MAIELVSILASAAVAIAAILGLVYAHYKEMAEVRERLARLETKVEPLTELPKQMAEVRERLARLEEQMRPLAEIPGRLARVETRLELTWNIVQSLPDLLRPRGPNPEPLTPREERKDELLVKFKEGVISLEEATELEGLLQEDLEVAKRERNAGLGLAILFVLAGLAYKKTEAKAK